jgi:GDSL-like Lipase/Acylhydrolase family
MRAIEPGGAPKRRPGCDCGGRLTQRAGVRRFMVRQTLFWSLLVGFVLLCGVAILEVMLRLFAPQPYIYPRYQYSERYGQVLYPSTVMVAEAPGQWRFTYTTSEYGFRAPTVPVSSRYDLPNVVVIGDSYSFGIGVDDGQEYPAVLAQLLAGQANVVNLGVPGYGLTQEIRLYYEFGRSFEPAIVLLQFSNNDPDDNLFYRVTDIEDGRFVFRRDRSISPFLQSVKDFLGRSIIQRSQAYNFARNIAYETMRERAVVRALDQGTSAAEREATDGKEDFHNALLELFVQDLDRRGVEVVLIGVDGHLAQFPRVLAKVKDLARRGLLTYVATEPWFRCVSSYASPEGHEWGVTANRIVAEQLAPLLAKFLAAPAEHSPEAAAAFGSGAPACAGP